jgi:hypothetical protein
MAIKDRVEACRNSTAESFASLCIGLWTVSLVTYLSSGISGGTYFLIILGAMCALLGIYLVLPWHLKQKSALEVLDKYKITRFAKPLIWLIVIAIFGVRLVQTQISWLISIGLITVVIAWVVFVFIWVEVTTTRQKQVN